MANLLIIKELAKRKGLSVKQLADLLGVTEQGLHKLIRSKSTNVATLERIAAKLEVSPCVFFQETSSLGDNVSIHDINGDNSGNVNKDTQTDKFLELLAKKDEQMDRLIGLLERGGVS
jgi:transcriptional regulator with XRE-family HTH domain